MAQAGAEGAARWFAGWRLVGLVALAVAVMAIALAAAAGWGEGGIRLAIRATARTSLVLFCAAFAAAALARRWPSGVTRWLRANRRALGLSFAASHLWHAVAIVALAWLHPEALMRLTSPVTFIVGGVSYLFIALMAATSFDAAACWRGGRPWRILHAVGAHVVWLNFVGSEAKRLGVHPGYWAALALLLAVMALRLLAPRRAPVSAGGIGPVQRSA